MLIKESEVPKKVNSKSCEILEYPDVLEDTSIAKADINGRFPEVGRIVNRESEEVYYVLSGSVKIISDKGEFYLNPGDIYKFSRAEKYYVEAELLEVLVINSPKRNPDQAEYIA